MALPDPIAVALEALQARFRTREPLEPVARPRRRKPRLLAHRRARSVLGAWRALNAALRQAGAPACPLRLTVDPDGPFASTYFHPRRQTIVVPYWEAPLAGLELAPDEDTVGHAFALLHEQAHARLYAQADAWLGTLPMALRHHLDPVWEQVPGHPAWLTFNEIYADASAAAWLLRLGDGCPKVRSMVEQLAAYRRARTHEAQQRGRPHYHATADAVDRILADAAWASLDPDEVEARVRRVALACFGRWLADGGQAWCEWFVEHRLRHPVLAQGLLGLAEATPAFVPAPHRAGAMAALREAQPHHPIFRLAAENAAT